MAFDTHFAGFFVLTFEYADKSGFHICGVTRNYVVAVAWFRAGDGDHKVYPVEEDRIAEFSSGFESWTSSEVKQ